MLHLLSFPAVSGLKATIAINILSRRFSNPKSLRRPFRDARYNERKIKNSVTKHRYLTAYPNSASLVSPPQHGLHAEWHQNNTRTEQKTKKKDKIRDSAAGKSLSRDGGGGRGNSVSQNQERENAGNARD